MQQHRASFTASRFSRPSTEDASTVYSYGPAAQPTSEPAGHNRSRHGQAAYEVDPSFDNSSYESEHGAGAYGAYPYPAFEYEPTAGFEADENPTVVTSPVVGQWRSESATHDDFLDDARAVPRRGGAHRIPQPPTALKGRAAVLAVAAGAVVAAGQAVLDEEAPATVSTSEYALAAGEAPAAAAVAAPATTQAAEVADDSSSATPSKAPQILNVAAPVDVSQFNDLLAKGQRFSDERAAREAAARRPLFALPAKGTYTSNFGTRWGVLHAGVDVANAIGTPIYAVADGKVIDSGPAAGFGMWVRLQHADGTITVYGHIDSSDVTVGQTVMAGDQIARMGNRGFSTGPHLHFEVHLPGEVKIDPLPWLASRGISLGPEMD